MIALFLTSSVKSLTKLINQQKESIRKNIFTFHRSIGQHHFDPVPVTNYEDILNMADNIYTNPEQQSPFIPLSNTMPIDIKESDEDYEIYIDLPGINKEDTSIHIVDDYLTVFAQPSVNLTNKNSKNEIYKLSERNIGEKSRVILLPNDIDEHNIKACKENGVLIINLPKLVKDQKISSTVDVLNKRIEVK